MLRRLLGTWASTAQLSRLARLPRVAASRYEVHGQNRIALLLRAAASGSSKPRHWATVGATMAVGVAAASGMAMAEPVVDPEESVQIVGPIEDLEIVLYAYEVCPFCNKLKAYLDYHNIPYRWVEVNPLTKAEMKFSSYRKVPLAVINGQQIGDSSKIINLLEPLVHSGSKDSAKSTSLFGFSSAKQSNPAPITEEDEQWFAWTDETLVRTLPPNIYRTLAEAMRSFDYLVETSKFTWYQRESARIVGGGAMYVVAKKLKKKYGIEDERKALFDAVDEWISAIGSKRTFLGGETPGRADLAVFGVLRSLEKFEVFPEMMEGTTVESWYRAMEKSVGESTRVQEPA